MGPNRRESPRQFRKQESLSGAILISSAWPSLSLSLSLVLQKTTRFRSVNLFKIRLKYSRRVDRFTINLPLLILRVTEEKSNLVDPLPDDDSSLIYRIYRRWEKKGGRSRIYIQESIATELFTDAKIYRAVVARSVTRSSCSRFVCFEHKKWISRHGAKHKRH